MASVKVKFRPAGGQGGRGVVYYQVIHERRLGRIFTDYRLMAGEWDAGRHTVAVPHVRSERGKVLYGMRQRIRQDIDRLHRIIRRLEYREYYSVDDVVEEYERYRRRYTLFAYMESNISRLCAQGKTRTAETYMAALRSFRKFRGGEDLMLDALSGEVLEAYELWHHRRGVAANTSSFYMRILRALYNRAIDQDIIDDRRPFRHVYTGVDKTEKRALPLVDLRRLRGLELTEHPALAYARDMFMLSFCMRGMSFVDMSFLRKTDLRDGVVTYRRRKTGQLLKVRWTGEMQAIVDRYAPGAVSPGGPAPGGYAPSADSPYLLPILGSEVEEEGDVTYRRKAYNINRALKRIGVMLNLGVPLTLYVARHSWASVARQQGVPLSVISEGMGHESEQTTRIYLASLDATQVDRANAKILASL